MTNDTDSIKKLMEKEVTLSHAKLGEALSLAYMQGAASALAVCELEACDIDDRESFIAAVLRASKLFSESEESEDTRVLRVMFAFLDFQEAIAEAKDKAERQQIRDEFKAKAWLPDGKI